MIILLYDYDIKYIYPFLHGPLLIYSITSCDAFIPHSLYRTTSFIIHTFGTVVSRRLYWDGLGETLNMDFKTTDEFYASFYSHFIKCFMVYLVWFIPYALYVFSYSGSSITMLRYILKTEDNVSTYNKLKYLINHLLGTMIGVSLGIVLMHNWKLDYVCVILQIMCGFLQGGYYYYSDGKKLKLFSKRKME